MKSVGITIVLKALKLGLLSDQAGEESAMKIWDFHALSILFLLSTGSSSGIGNKNRPALLDKHFHNSSW